MLESFFMMLQASSLQVFQKLTPTQVLPCEVCETCKSTYFEEHLQGLLLDVFYQKAVLENFAIFTGRK